MESHAGWRTRSADRLLQPRGICPLPLAQSGVIEAKFGHSQYVQGSPSYDFPRSGFLRLMRNRDLNEIQFYSYTATCKILRNACSSTINLKLELPGVDRYAANDIRRLVPLCKSRLVNGLVIFLKSMKVTDIVSSLNISPDRWSTCACSVAVAISYLGYKRVPYCV